MCAQYLYWTYHWGQSTSSISLLGGTDLPSCCREKAIHKCLEVPQSKFLFFLVQKVFGGWKLWELHIYQGKMESKRGEETKSLPNLEAPGAREHSQFPTATPDFMRHPPFTNHGEGFLTKIHQSTLWELEFWSGFPDFQHIHSSSCLLQSFSEVFP